MFIDQLTLFAIIDIPSRILCNASRQYIYKKDFQICIIDENFQVLALKRSERMLTRLPLYPSNPSIDKQYKQVSGSMKNEHMLITCIMIIICRIKHIS